MLLTRASACNGNGVKLTLKECTYVCYIWISWLIPLISQAQISKSKTIQYDEYNWLIERNTLYIVNLFFQCTLRLASFRKGFSEKGCHRTPMPIEDSWSKRFRHFPFVSACILWPRHGHLPLPTTLPQWKIQFSQSLLIFSSLCGCLVCCTIRCCCCWPSRKSVKS